jgi:hypothetical protein
MWTWNSSSFSSFSSSAWGPFSGARIRVSTSAGAASNGLAESTPIPSRAVAEVRSIGVVGLGAMGAGIAQLAVEAGSDTVGREVTAELGERAKGQIRHVLTRKVEKGQRTQEERDAALGRLSLTTDLADLAEC